MHVFFSVGEPSGDQHAALLIDELRRRQPNMRVSGFGGPRMEQSGCQILYPLTNLAVMGILEVLPKIWQFFQVVALGRDYFARHKPDLVVLIDFPGFNWWIARAAKKHGIPVVYYLPPQLWAWASWRIRKVRKYIDLVLSGLPFEAEWYALKKVPVLYVGHPFFDEVTQHPLDESFMREWRSERGPTVALLPGSRGHEVTGNWPLMLEAARRLTERHPNVQFLVANYKESQRQFCQDLYRKSGLRLPISFFVGKTPEIIQLGDCALMVSGSVSLEMLARGTPATVLYRTTWFTYLVGKMLVTVKHLSLPNLIANRAILPEHLSVGRTEPAIAGVTANLDRWLSHPETLAETRMEMATIRRQVGAVGATGRAAEVILSRLTDAVAKNRAA
ncbi:MAG: lipid-A-disaccharide synthase [Planctomycetaceae bacterium]|nr:lipid-A-disaccharide synthase [Planctomycetaceae bacterium]